MIRERHMPMLGKRFRACMILALVVVYGAGQATWAAGRLAPGKPPTEILPADTILLLSLPDLGATSKRATENALYRIWMDPIVQEFLRPALARVSEALGQAETQLRQNTRFSFEDIRRLFDGQLAFAIADMKATPHGLRPRLVFLLAPKDTDHLRTSIEKVTALAGERDRQRWTRRMVQGVEVTESPTPESGPLAWAVAGDTFILTLGDGAMDDVLSTWVGQPASPRLSENYVHKTVIKGLRATDDLMLYANLARIRTLVQENSPPDVEKLIRALALADVEAIVQGCSLRGPAIEDCLYLHMPQFQGRLANLLRPEPVNQELLANVPAEAVHVQLTRLNLLLLDEYLCSAAQEVAPEKYAEFRRNLAGFEQLLGFSIERDLLASLGKEIIIYRLPVATGPQAEPPLATPQMGPLAALRSSISIGTVFLMPVTDAVKVRDGLKKLADFAVTMASRPAQPSQIRFEENTVEGVVIRSLSGQPPEKAFPLCYAVTDKFLIAGLHRPTLERAIAHTMRPGPNFLESKLMDQARPFVWGGSGSVLISDPRSGTAEALRAIWATLRTLPIRPMGPPDILAIFDEAPEPLIAAANRYLFTTVSCVRNEPLGMSIRGYSPGGQTAFIPGAALGAAILLPALSRSRESARVSVDANNLQQVAVAIEAYKAANRNQTPPLLNDLVPKYLPDERTLRSPGDDAAPGPGEQFRVSYRYIGALPANIHDLKVIIAYTKPGIRRNGRNCLYADGHVKFVPEANLRTELATSRKTLMEAAARAGVKLDQARVDAFYEDRD